MTTFREHLRERLKDLVFSQAWEESEPDYRTQSSLIKNAADSNGIYKEKQCPKCYAYLDFYGSCPVCGYGDCPICAQYSSRKRGKNNGPRGRAYLRHQRQRIIAKRQNIIKYVWGEINRYYFLVNDGCFGSPRHFDITGYDSYWNQSVFSKEPGRLAKHNLSCGCWRCKYEKHMGVLKPKYRFWYSDQCFS